MQYFPDRPDIDDYRVVWSKTVQKSVLASCNVQHRRIRVAPSFQRIDCTPFLEALLYHEMCHAILGDPPRVRGRRVLHGKDFRELEVRHPGIPNLDRWILEGGWRLAVQRHRRETSQGTPSRTRSRKQRVRRRPRLRIV
ncbi:MAG: SprT-like domain-containing protein [Deltaproteobacteria bacterium]|nr:SprT-like domain-containing protein [Deltaproteobacteria bacterium]